MTTKVCTPSQLCDGHQWYQASTGEQYCRTCEMIITKSGKWLPPNMGWNPMYPSPYDRPITDDMLNLGWKNPPAPVPGEDGEV